MRNLYEVDSQFEKKEGNRRGRESKESSLRKSKEETNTDIETL